MIYSVVKKKLLIFFKAALEIEPEDISTLDALARSYRRLRKWEELVELLIKVGGSTGNSSKAAAIFAEVGDIYDFELHNINLAIDYYQRALSIDPGHEGSFKALCKLHTQVCDYRQLVRLYEDAVARSSTDEERVAHLLKIGALWEESLSDPSRAVSAYSQVCKIAPKNLLAWRALQRTQELGGLWQDLIVSLQAEANLVEDKAVISAIHAKVGRLYDQRQKDEVLARESYERALDLAPANEDARRGLKQVYFRNGNWSEVLELLELERRFTTSPEDIYALSIRMGELCLGHLDDYERAVTFFESAVEANQKCQEAHLALVGAHRSQKNWPSLIDALQNLYSVETKAEQRAELQFQIGEIWEVHESHVPEAIKCYTKSLVDHPSYRPATLALIRLQSQSENWGELIAHLDSEITTTTDPERQVTLRLAQGETLVSRLDNLEDAAECFEAASNSATGKLPALLALESIYNRLGAWGTVGRCLHAPNGML